MAKKNGANPTDKKLKKSRKIPIRLIGITLLAAFIAGGWFTYTTYFQSDYPKRDLPHINLAEPVLRFTWNKIPNIYRHMVSANDALALMEEEINRIKGVGRKYPRQKKIVASEKKRWDKNVKKLKGQLLKFQGQVEALYVTFRVNPKKGRTAILEKRADLEASMKEVMTGVETETEPLRRARMLPKGMKGVIAKIKKIVEGVGL